MKNSYLQKILSNRGILAYFFALGLMLVALIIALDIVLDAHASAEAVGQKIEMMKNATESFDRKKAVLDKATAKPITGEKIDDIQTSILLQIQRYNLSLTSLNSVSASDSKEKNEIFEIDVSGSYDNTMSFLSSFRKDTKALISILSVHFNPKNDVLNTTIKYKVYVR